MWQINKNFKRIILLTTFAAVSLITYFIVTKTEKFATYTAPKILVAKSITKTQLNASPKLGIIPQEIIGSIVTLRRLEPKYFRGYHEMFSDIVREAIRYPKHITFTFTKNLLLYEMRKEAEGKMIYYCIFDNKDQNLIGSIEIKEKNEKDPGQFSVWVNENYWGGGRFQEAVDIISTVYFKYVGKEKYDAHVELFNKRSYYALKKYGFKEIGYFYENGEATRYILELYNPYIKHTPKPAKANQSQ